MQIKTCDGYKRLEAKINQLLSIEVKQTRYANILQQHIYQIWSKMKDPVSNERERTESLAPI